MGPYATYSQLDDRSIDYDYPSKEHGAAEAQQPSGTTWWNIFGYIPFFKSLLMAQASFVGAIAMAVASVGLGLLVFVALLRMYAPDCVTHVRPLHFDYTQSQAVAMASFAATSLGQTTVPALPGSRAFPTAQQMQVTVQMRLPETPRNKQIFQLTGELVTGDGRVAARSTRAVMLSHRSVLVQYIRQLARLPLVLVGLRDESQMVAVKLFEAYEEKEAFPVVYFRALLAPSHGASAPPEVYDAKLSVRLRLGWTSSLMYYLRPSLPTTLLLTFVATVCLASGSTTLLILGLFVYIVFSATHTPTAPAPPHTPDEKGQGGEDMEDEMDAVSEASLAAYPPLYPKREDEGSASNSWDDSDIRGG